MMKLSIARRAFHKELGDIHEVEEIDALFFRVTEAFLQIGRLDLATQPSLSISPKEHLLLEDALHQLKEQRPIQYVVGTTPFHGHTFAVDERVLIPRPETEELVDWILSETEKNVELHILDIGTGSGCIAISLAKALPKSTVEAWDVSKKALELAKRNAGENDATLQLKNIDIMKIESLKNKYDMIVSNPPYVSISEKERMTPNVLNYEPPQALFVNDKDPLLFYRKIGKLAREGLYPKGRLFVEINEAYGSEVVALLQEMGFKDVLLRRDFRGKDRMIRAGVKDDPC